MAKRGPVSTKDKEPSSPVKENKEASPDPKPTTEFDPNETALPVKDGRGGALDGLDLTHAGEAVAAPIADGLGDSVGEGLLDEDPSGFDDVTSELLTDSTTEAGSEFDHLSSSDLDDPADLDTDGAFGLADGRTNADGFEMGEDEPGNGDPTQYTGDFGGGDALSLLSGGLGFAAAAGSTAAFTLTAASSGALLGAATAGYTTGTIINDNIVDPAVDAIAEELEKPAGSEFGEGEKVKDDEEKTNEPDGKSGLLKDQDHGDPAKQSTTPEPANGQSQEAEPGSGQSREPEPEPGSGQSREPEPEPGSGQSEGAPAAGPDEQPETPAVEDRGAGGVDPEEHAEWLARQDPSILETYLAIEEAAVAGSEVNPIREGGETEMSHTLADQIDYGEGYVAPTYDGDLDEALDNHVEWEFDSGGE